MVASLNFDFYGFGGFFSSHKFSNFSFFFFFILYSLILTNFFILSRLFFFKSEAGSVKYKTYRKKSPKVAGAPPEGEDKSVFKKAWDWLKKNYVPFLAGAATATVTIITVYIIYQHWGDFPKKPPSVPPIPPTPSLPETPMQGVSEDSWEKGYMQVYEKVGIKPKKDTETLRLYYLLMENVLALCEEAGNSLGNLVDSKNSVADIVGWLKECGSDQDLFYRRLSYHYYLELKSEKLKTLLENIPRTEGNKDTVEELMRIYKKTITPI